MQLGSYDNIINSVVNNYTGHIQIHKEGYWDDKMIDNVFSSNKELTNILDSIPEIDFYAPRVEAFALASVGNKTKGVAVIGVNPKIENSFSKLDSRLIEGQLLDKGEGALIGSRLAKYLKLKVNDTLILLGQGYHGYTASGRFPIKGIVKLPSPDLDNKFVYLNIELAQHLYYLDDKLTSLAIKLKDNEDMEDMSIALRERLKNKDLEIMQWNEMMPEIEQQIQSDNVSSLIMLWLLYLIVGFGIFGTILMMLTERRREFGVMLALGMKRYRMASLILIEILEITVLGLVSGVLVSLPIIIYFHMHPIPLTGEMAESIEQYGWEAVLKFALYPDYFINQCLTVLIIVAFTIIYPLVTILRLNAVKAIKA
jgi:ABC-type lipoprotein release transport system permease subunit